MDENNSDDTRQSLYDEFESEIVKAGNTEAFFDENDLIEIFDYASDMDNYIVKMEVLLYGSRHYPGSEPLATRRAWFYSSLGEMEAAAQVNSRVSNGGVLNHILSLRAEGATDTPETRSRLDAIVDATDDFGDEDVIQLVDFCAEISMLDWVEQNRSRIEAKCSYSPTFIYEYADRAEDIGDLPTAQRLFEELTMMEPFTVDFWVRLARVQYDQGNDEDALASADYALAVDPAYADALRVKGKALFRLDRDLNEVSAAFEAVLHDPEHNDTDSAVYAATLHELGETDKAINLLETAVLKSPFSQPLLDVLMKIDFDRAIPYVLNVSERTSFPCETVIAWAKEHIANNRVDVAARLVTLFADKFDSQNSLGFLTELWYISGMYPRIVEIVRNRYPGDSPLNSLSTPDPAITFPYLMSLSRLGRNQEALAEAKSHLSEIDEFLQTPHHTRFAFTLTPDDLPSRARCLHIGYAAILRSIVNALSAIPALPPDTFDPLML